MNTSKLLFAVCALVFVNTLLLVNLKYGYVNHRNFNLGVLLPKEEEKMSVFKGKLIQVAEPGKLLLMEYEEDGSKKIAKIFTEKADYDIEVIQWSALMGQVVCVEYLYGQKQDDGLGGVVVNSKRIVTKCYD